MRISLFVPPVYVFPDRGDRQFVLVHHHLELENARVALVGRASEVLECARAFKRPRIQFKRPRMRARV